MPDWSQSIAQGVSLMCKRGWFHLRFYDKTRTPPAKTVSLETTHEGIARRKANDLYRQYETGHHDPWGQRQDTFLGNALEAYIEDRRRDGVRPKTIATYEDRIGRLKASLGADTPLSAITDKDIRREVIRPGLRKMSQYTRYQSLHAFFQWCVENRMMAENPVRLMRRPDKPPSVPKYITQEQFYALIDQIKADYEEKRSMLRNPDEIIWLVPLLFVAVYTGLRMDELASLTWDSVTLPDEGQAWINVSDRDLVAKANSFGRIPIPPVAALILRSLPRRGDRVFLTPNGKVLHQSNLLRALKAQVRRAGLPDYVNMHTFRHSYASWLVAAGEDLLRVQYLLRHKDVSTTRVYAHLAPDHLAASVNRVFSGRSRQSVNNSFDPASTPTLKKP
jgi:integrase/recombinase XerD